MGQHAGVRPRHPLVTLSLAVGLSLAATACNDFDEAAMAGPDAEVVTAEPGQLRVLRYADDPPAGDDWITVLEADASVIVPTGSFREADARDAAEDEPADVRLLYEAAEPGRTVLVVVNCRSCDGGVPATAVEDTAIHVWDLVVGGVGTLQLGADAAEVDRPHDMVVGEHVVVVRDPAASTGLAPLDEAILVPVARHDPSDGAELLVDVFAAVGPGEATITYDDGDAYPVGVATPAGR